MTRLNVLTAAALLAVLFGTYSGAAAQDLYGSVAFSTEPEGGYAWGIAWDHDSQGGARWRALAACRERGGSRCQEEVSFLNGCGALFIGGGNGWGIGTGGSRLRAEAKAREACESVNEDCRLAVSRCTSGPGTTPEIKSEAGGFEALYGSIAFSQEVTGGYVWGMSWDHGSHEAATGGAIAAVSGRGRDLLCRAALVSQWLRRVDRRLPQFLGSRTGRVEGQGGNKGARSLSILHHRLPVGDFAVHLTGWSPALDHGAGGQLPAPLGGPRSAGHGNRRPTAD